VNEKAGKDQLSAEIGRGNFTRAALVAASLGLPDREVEDLRLKALWQISAVYRNATGTKRLALQYGLSKKDVTAFFEKHANELRSKGDERALEPCYDHSTAKYLSFEEWMDQLAKDWDKLPTS
jgi:hypothetical protein